MWQDPFNKLVNAKSKKHYGRINERIDIDYLSCSSQLKIQKRINDSKSDEFDKNDSLVIC